MAFDLVSWIKSGFKTGKDAVSIKETAQGVIANAKQVSQLLGSSAPVSWANEALTQLSSSEKNAGRKNQNGVDLGARDLAKASDWISGAAQSHIAAGLSGRLEKNQAKTSAQLSNLQSNVQNTLAGVGKGTLSAAEETALKAQAAKTQAKIDALSPFATLVGAKAGTTALASGDVIPTANLDHGQRMNAAAERQAAIERAAGIATNVAGGSQATASNVAAANTAAPKATTIDNNVDGRAFVESPTAVSVGGTANNQGTTPSPVFVGPDGTSLYYIPSGTNQPQKITDPAQLQNLVGSGAVAPGDQSTYKPLASAQDWLTSQHPSSQTSTGAGLKTDLAMQEQAALEPARSEVHQMEQYILDFDRTDYNKLRSDSEKSLGIDGIMNELSTVDRSLADLLNVQDRVPQTTLDAAKGTFVTQGVLDRQRTNILQQLAATSAPLSRLKSVLQDDLTRREKLIDDAVATAKESDSFKLQKLGYALDYATTNLSMETSKAEAIFNAAVSDYEDKQKALDDAAKQKKADEKDYQKQLTDYYAAKGYLVNPTTGELEVKPVKSSSKKTYLPTSQVDYITATLNAAVGADGKTNPALYSDLYQQTAAMSGPEAGKEFLARFPASGWLSPTDPTAAVYFGTKPSSGTLSSDSDFEAMIASLAGSALPTL